MTVRRLAASRTQKLGLRPWRTEMISRKLPLHLAAGTLALGIAIAAPAATWAQPTAGHVFRFSSCFSCSQHNPTGAGNAAGDFLGTWTQPRGVISEAVFSR